jgi:sigma-E factor negative regulatory protein RseC
MEQYGVVHRVDGKLAKVSIRQHSACAQCGKCNLAHESKDLMIDAVNQAGAHIGDTVLLQMGQRDVLSAGLIAYGLPLLLMFVGAVVGQSFFGQAGSALLGFSGLGLTYAFIHWYLEPKLKANQRYSICITEVIDEKGDF